MSLPKLTSLGLLLLACAAPLAACSSDPDEPGPASPSSKSTRVSAEKGGTVSDPSGTATLTIPAGALAEDTDITLAVGAATSATVSSVYDFGPDGLTFVTPAVLTVKVEAAAIGDKKVALAIEQGGKFVPLAGSAYANGVVTAPVEHFSKFSVVFVDGEAVNNSCDDAVSAFQACGGDVQGTWILETLCIAGVEGPLDGCPQQEASLEMDHAGVEYSFGEDGSFNSTAGTETEKVTVTAPISCFGAESCDTVSSESNVACSGEDVCTCTRTTSDSKEAEQGTYTAEDGTLTVTTDGEGTPHRYCIQGDKLQLLLDDEDEGQTMLVTFKKK